MYLILISIHGLIRGSNLELGRDADTGGQTQYVVDLARALSARPEVAQVDLVTRLVADAKVSEDYASPMEPLTAKARIVRLPCGPRRYLRKEVLWPYLDVFADELLRHIRSTAKVPHVLHSHYADAGYVGVRVSRWLGIPLMHTGHSLGRVKLQRLLAQGQRWESLEEQFHFSARIEAEESILENASLIVASTHQEIREQYQLYDRQRPDRIVVIPPGIDLQRFQVAPAVNPPIQAKIEQFLTDPSKPIVLALSRPVPCKNLQALVRAYGESPELRRTANLLVVLGSRGSIRDMEAAPRQVLTEILLLIDLYDLYGSVAYPKSHTAEDVPHIYRLVAQSRGVHINPALTEPFGLTLLEAAACGLPIVATSDGGPRDIIANCNNGLLVDPLDMLSLQAGLMEALTNTAQWNQWSESGLAGVKRHYTWESHVTSYLSFVHSLSPKTLQFASPHRGWQDSTSTSRLLVAERLLISDIDNTLLGDRDALQKLMDYLSAQNPPIGFGVATGRHLESALAILTEWGVPLPDLWITSVGSEIHYGAHLESDTSWQRHISRHWQPELLRRAMGELRGVSPQSLEQQRPHKISYLLDPSHAPSLREIRAHLRRHKLSARTIFSHQKYLDLLPLRASKGDAVRYCAIKWGFPLQQILVAGDSGNDEQMLIGNTRAVVVGNHSQELAKLKGQPNVYFASGHFAQGILEAIEHYRF